MFRSGVETKAVSFKIDILLIIYFKAPEWFYGDDQSCAQIYKAGRDYNRYRETVTRKSEGKRPRDYDEEEAVAKRLKPIFRVCKP